MGTIKSTNIRRLKEKFRNWCDEIIPPFHYGSHYSCAGIILHYLLRLEPFTRINHDFHGNSFDVPERMFLSICESFQSTILNNSDVRELIPEFYYFPEFLSNLNNTNFGVLNLNEHHLENRRIGNIKVPKWANNSFEEFIKIHRRALESDYVSANLHHWIDLIFGFKQTGEEAKRQ
ncbi:neurobeachin [Anaeramoeba flamelloides]|uniref:Neurobeachin n=1 Tax=Anaeramoeba flamelloides TaxID=1746091 RepID=A0ABQ8YKN6_9EUKA|nr:neurobeachin [Anaeramoeba flamelloides]